MRRFTIMGFTEAELGFVLAALFVALAVTAIDERDASAVSVDRQAQIADSLAAEVEAMSDSVARLRNSFAFMRDSIEALEAKISTKVPQCWEKGEPQTSIADVDVLGADRYRINGDVVNIDGIRERLAPFIARADSLDCRYIVRARPTSGIDAVQQSAAVWRLRRYFDVNDRPR